MDIGPSPVAILDSLRPRVSGLSLDFPIHDGDWSEGVFHLEDKSHPVVLLHRIRPGHDSFLWDRDGWEAELRSWNGPHCEYVIQHIHKTRQTVTVVPIKTTLGHSKLARICEQICGHLARATDGLIHVYQEGIFNADGESLLPYAPQHKLKTS